MTIRTFANRLLDVPPTDPDDARRRKLLNILLLGIGGLAFLVFLWPIISFIAVAFNGTAMGTEEELSMLLIGGLVMMAGTATIFVINRYGSGWLAALLFLLLFLGVSAFSDKPEQITDGRTLFIFAIPILMASVILRPYASFLAAGISSIIIAILALSIGVPPNVPAMLSFFTVALVSWLSARSLEHALADLRTINRELDQRVADRTTDLSKALTHVQAESSKTQAILESIADGVIVFDNNNTAIVSNPSISLLLGLSTGRIIGRTIDSLLREKVSAEVRENVLGYRRGDDATESSIKLNWDRKTLSVSLAPVRLASGETTGTVAVFRDFTKEAELDRMKSAFVSMASHEMRTPLNAILGYADMLKENVYGPLQDEQCGIMDRIIANTKRMLGLINNLLDQAQIEAGKLQLETAPFSPAALLGELQSVVGVLAETKQLAFSYQIEDDVPDILQGDPRRLNQILINLVGNAVKFTEEGSVRVHVYRPDETHWAFDVSDTGPGIPEEAQEYIFEPFRQVDDPITRKHTGSGLGLSIVEQITTLMGGEIKLDSELGKGSTFTIVLPLEPLKEKHA